MPGFESLFATLGVEIDDGIRRAIEGHSGEGNPTELREKHDVRLDSARERRVAGGGGSSPTRSSGSATGVADVAPAFYSDEDW